MPYVFIQAVDIKRASAAAIELAAQVAATLGLHPSDVVVTVAASQGVFDGSGLRNEWPSAILHGTRRDPVAMEAALGDARSVLASAFDVSTHEVWAEWCIASIEPPANA